MKECGGCTWCCYFCRVPQVNTVEYKMCNYCIPYCGCSDYDNRPKSCATMACVWLQEEHLSEVYRPDRCGMMFEVVADDIVGGHCLPGNDWKWGGNELLIKALNEKGYSVVIVIAKNKQSLIYPKSGSSIQTVIEKIRGLMDDST